MVTALFCSSGELDRKWMLLMHRARTHVEGIQNFVWRLRERLRKERENLVKW